MARALGADSLFQTREPRQGVNGGTWLFYVRAASTALRTSS